MPVRPDNVVDETLRRVAGVPAPPTAGEIRAAVEAAPPEPTLESVTHHPLAGWVEETFGLDVEDGRLVRRAPLAFVDGLRRLVDTTGLDEGFCRERLKGVLEAGNQARTPSGDPVFAFRLHQFLSSGGSVFATIQSPEARYLTTEGQHVVPVGDGQEQRLLYPLAFCRDCGQEYYLVSRVGDGGDQALIPRSPLLNAPDDDTEGTLGFFSLERDGLWSGDIAELPDAWFEPRRAGTIRERYGPHVPVRCWARPDGGLSNAETDGAVEGWFQPRPLMLCLRCRAAYDLRERGDFRKLATLSQTGRSTATTIVGNAAVVALRNDTGIEPTARKLLSFTDNRQDASLQAGHLNDFVQVALLRGALDGAVEREGSLSFDRLGPAVFDSLGLATEQFMKEARETGPGVATARQTMIDLLEYRGFEDLRRAWRVAQPNLEQCGLLRIDYDGLAELTADEAAWAGAPAVAAVTPERRMDVLRAVLDHLRGLLAIDAACLKGDRIRSLTQRANQWLREPWAIDEQERLRRGAIALLPGVAPANREEAPTIGLGYRSAVGRSLRSRRTRLISDHRFRRLPFIRHGPWRQGRGHPRTPGLRRASGRATD